MKNLTEEEQDNLDGYPYGFKTIKKKNKELWQILPFVLIIILLILLVVSCKKKENKPTPIKSTYVPPQENLWLLGGDWKCIGGDTIFTGILHIHYCCEADQGSSAVYYVSYPIWWHKTNVTVPYYYNTDSLWLDNGIVGIGSKTVLFGKIK